MRDPIAAALTRAIGTHVIEGSAEPVGGGSIHESLRYRTRHGSIFVKVGAPATREMFAAEAAGLAALARANAVHVPAVLAIDGDDERAFLCLEWLELGPPSSAAQRLLGEQLAQLHRTTASMHGAHRDNFIGRTAQRNRNHASWPEFFRVERLLPQLAYARTQRADARTLDRGAQLAESIGAFFTAYEPVPSLLHGDLWGGNWGAMRDGRPTIFDPAVYFGDRETDVAMTRLFGGFGPQFYAAYESTWPLDSGSGMRATLYNLYHVLNHFNLFGGGYLAQARTMIDRLLADIGR